MGKKILVVLAGIVISAIVIGVIEFIGHQVFPPPADLDITNKEMMADFIANLPLGALLFVVGAWLIGPLVGSFIACKFMPEEWRHIAIGIGVAIAIFTVMNIMMFPHPLWMTVVGALFPLPMAYLGGMLAVGKANKGT